VQTKPEQPLSEDAAAEGAEGQPPVAGEVAMPDFRGMSMRRVLQVMEKRNINIRLMGSGRAVEQNPPPGHKIRGSGEVWVKFVPAA
jgi:cell division protein FtsI (penicillin-binding protein 3)